MMPWLKQPASHRTADIAGVLLHSSRGGPNSSVQNDGPATEAWLSNPSNGSQAQGWGGSADLIIFGDGTRVRCLMWDRESPTYGAGYGDAGSWDASRFYLNVELAQHIESAPFDPRTIDSLAEWTARMSIEFHFPLVRLPFLWQKEQPIPKGITAHDATMNGRKYGKSDPGHMFPWDVYLTKAIDYQWKMQGGDGAMTPDERKLFDDLKREYEYTRDCLYVFALLQSFDLAGAKAKLAEMKSPR